MAAAILYGIYRSFEPRTLEVDRSQCSVFPVWAAEYPQDLYESADIDGASSLQKFTKITFPMLKPMTIYVLTISIYGGMSMFTESYMLWSGNRSPQDIGLTIVGFLYRSGWEQNTMGLGSAVGIVLLIFTLIVNMIQLNFFGIFKKEEN